MSNNDQSEEKFNTLVVQLQELGIEKSVAENAVTATGKIDVEQAMNWILDQQSKAPEPIASETPTQSQTQQMRFDFNFSGNNTPLDTNMSQLLEQLAKVVAPSKPIRHCKLVLCVRKDINMQTGKIASQCSHATLGVYKYVLHHMENGKALLRTWDREGEPTVCLKINSLQELNDLQSKAFSLGLATHAVADAGRTQVESGSVTVLAIFGPDTIVNEVTGHLKLL